ncbi:MAG: hypothetical protein U0229_22600 [Anaeromyxobacter sp.]
MRIATYNFLVGGSARRARQWERLHERLAPDVIFAQEAPEPPPGRGVALWQRARGRRWGSGVWLATGSIVPLPVRGFAGWVVGGEVALPGRHARRPLRVFSIHCPAGAHGYVRTLGTILDRLARLGEGAELLVGGDLNVVAGYRDLGERVRMLRAEERLLDRFAADLGLVPAWQAMHPGEPLAQTLRWSGDRSMPYHCDGIFVPRAWVRRLVSAEVVTGRLWTRLSDHNPVVAEVR